ncbi:MAG: Nif3-like dinuclear metal center hexameric protein [Verrucomicrobiota bacterium]
MIDSAMIALEDVVRHLDLELKTAAISDYPGAMNGLQLANEGEIGRIVAAVDASLPVIEKAAAGGPGLLIVHHGMFWQGAQPVTGALYKKLRIAMEAGLAVYSSHLPLDVHPELGNNILLANEIGLRNLKPFFDQKGLSLGLRGIWEGSRSDLLGILKSIVAGPVHLCPGGSDVISQVGVITGGAGSEVMKVAASGVDTFITGEGPHWSYPLAEELGLNVFYGGHYATEVFGVKALAESLSKQFGIPWNFVDHPTGL